MTQAQIQEILYNAKVIAVIGLSKDPNKDSHRVSAYMKKFGYRIIPINPTIDEVLGEKSYKNLLEVPTEIQKTIDIVDVFRKVEDVPMIIEHAIALKTLVARSFVVWLQMGIVDEKSAGTARKAGLTVVMDKCIMVEHCRLT